MYTLTFTYVSYFQITSKALEIAPSKSIEKKQNLNIIFQISMFPKSNLEKSEIRVFFSKLFFETYQLPSGNGQRIINNWPRLTNDTL